MIGLIRNFKATLAERVGQWAPAGSQATTYFRPMPWEIDRNGRLRPKAAMSMAALACRGWQGAAGYGRTRRGAGAALIGDIGGTGRFIALERLSIGTRLIEEVDGFWILEHRIESEDQCARAVFTTRIRTSEEGRWSFFGPKAPAAVHVVKDETGKPLPKAA